MNENQNLTIKVKLSANMEGNTLGVATLFLNTSIGDIKITGFRIIKSSYSTDVLPENIDVMPPSFKNRFGKYSPIFFLVPNNPELSKEKWLKLKKLIYNVYAKELSERPIEEEELDINEIDEGIKAMKSETSIDL